MLTPTEVVTYEQAWSARETADLLLLGGPDYFDGDYSTTLIHLEQIATDERDLERANKSREYAESTTWKAIHAYRAGMHTGRIEHCRQVLKALAQGYEDRVKDGLHYV